jgi:hypothetical protein
LCLEGKYPGQVTKFSYEHGKNIDKAQRGILEVKYYREDINEGNENKKNSMSRTLCSLFWKEYHFISDSSKSTLNHPI